MKFQIPARVMRFLTSFMTPDTRYDEHNEPYLTRYTLRGTKEKGRWTINHFHKKDGDRALHNHPWEEGYSVILSGGYLEQRLTDRATYTVTHRIYTPFMVNDLGKGTFHRVAALHGDTWTFMSVGPNYEGWGFLTRARGFIVKSDYFKERGVKEEKVQAHQ